MGNEDVVVSIGGDLTPIQRTFAQLKVGAKQAGEQAGLEFGNRTAYMAEARVKRGMEGVLRSLATAKDPIDAISGAVEGLGQSFRIAGAAFLAVGVGTFLKDQLEKAAQGAEDFYAKTTDIFAVGNESSRAFTEKAVKDFEDAKAAYGKEGLFEWLIYGAGQKETLENGEEAYEQALEKIRSMREADYKAEADAESENAQVRMEGEIEKINEKYDAEIAKAKEAGDSIVEIERAKAEAIEKIQVDAAKKAQEEIRALAVAQSEDPGLSEADKLANKKKFAQQDLDSARDTVAKNNAKELEAKDNVEQARQQLALAQRTQDRYAADPNKTPGAGQIINENVQKAADDLVKAQQNLAGVQEQSIIDQTTAQKALNALKEVELEVDKAKKEEEKKTADAYQKKVNAFLKGNEKDAEIKKKQQEKRKQEVAEVTKRRDDLQRELPQAADEAATAEARAMGFHGQVSSLRREGFGRTPSGGADNSQLKAAQASEKHLSDIRTEISQLNAKIGGSV